MDCKHHFRRNLLELFERLVAAVESIAGPPRGPKLFISRLILSGLTITGEIMAFQITDSGSASASVIAKTAAGNPATIDSPTWASSDPAILLVTASEDGLTATVAAVGPVGTAQVQFSCDADIGEGERTLTGFADVEVIAGEAAVVEISLTSN